MKALGIFWIVVVAALAGGAAVLHVLGPPDRVTATGRGAGQPDVAPAPAGTDRPGETGPEAGRAAGSTPEASVASSAAPPPVLAAPTSPPMAASPSTGPVAVPSAGSVFPRPDAPGGDRPGDAARIAAPALPSAPEPPPLPRLPDPPAAVADRPIPPPDPALLEASPHGPVPRVGPEGRSSIRAYARAFDRADARPRVALVVGNLGLSASLSEEAIRRLPPATALAFSPYALRPEPLLERARARGMEVLSALPLEPAGYPMSDPGERGLLTGNPPAENADRLAWTLARIRGQVGAVGALGPMRGERFAAVPELLNGLQDALRVRGLLYLDPRPGVPAPARSFGRGTDILVDEPATRGEIERRLADLERLARERGSALGLATDPSPVLVDRVVAWAAGLEERGLVLAPVTVLVRRGEDVPR